MTTEQIEERVHQLMEETREVITGYHSRYIDAFSVFEVGVVGDPEGISASVICHYHIADVCEQVVTLICPARLQDEEYFQEVSIGLMLVMSAPIRSGAMRALFPEEYHGSPSD